MMRIHNSVTCLPFVEYILMRLRIFFALHVSKMEQDTDTALSERVKQQAERLFHAHKNSILRLSYSYLHNMVDAEEILQETLIQFLKTAPTLSSPSHEKAWLLRVAGNLSKNRIQYNSLRRTDELQESLLSDNCSDLSFVWDAVKQLPPSCREVIHLYYYEGYSSQEIARILGRNASTVRSNLRDGRMKLRQQLKEAYDFE